MGGTQNKTKSVVFSIFFLCSDSLQLLFQFAIATGFYVRKVLVVVLSGTTSYSFNCPQNLLIFLPL